MAELLIKRVTGDWHTPTDDEIVAAATGIMRDRLAALAEEGTTCPACEQHVKIYKRKIHASMAAMLIAMYRKAPNGEWIYLPDLPQKSRDGTGLAHWGLIEEERERREDGGRAGYWRVTETGRLFARRQTAVRKYAYVYNGEVLELTGEKIDIEDCLGDKFDYRELMNS